MTSKDIDTLMDEIKALVRSMISEDKESSDMGSYYEERNLRETLGELFLTPDPGWLSDLTEGDEVIVITKTESGTNKALGVVLKSYVGAGKIPISIGEVYNRLYSRKTGKATDNDVESWLEPATGLLRVGDTRIEPLST